MLDDLALLQQLLPLARRAGSAIMAVYQRDTIVAEYKADASPLTEADLVSHACIMQGLAAITPEMPVLSEEGRSVAEVVADRPFWLVDPLDGTKEFLSRSGEFTVNIALIDQGISRLGVVYAPALDVMYWGGHAIGAFRETAAERRAIHVSDNVQTGPCRVVASRHHLSAETQALIDALGDCALVQAGSSLKFCLIAEGQADLYPRLAPTCEWDTAAAQAVLEGAGGVVVDVSGRRLHYGKADPLNPSFIASRHPALIPNPASARPVKSE